MPHLDPHFASQYNQISVVTGTVSVYVKMSVPTRHAGMKSWIDLVISVVVKRSDCSEFQCNSLIRVTLEAMKDRHM